VPELRARLARIVELAASDCVRSEASTIRLSAETAGAANCSWRRTLRALRRSAA
jgi:hypothetical protein